MSGLRSSLESNESNRPCSSRQPTPFDRNHTRTSSTRFGEVDEAGHSRTCCYLASSRACKRAKSSGRPNRKNSKIRKYGRYKNDRLSRRQRSHPACFLLFQQDHNNLSPSMKELCRYTKQSHLSELTDICRMAVPPQPSLHRLPRFPRASTFRLLRPTLHIHLYPLRFATSQLRISYLD